MNSDQAHERADHWRLQIHQEWASLEVTVHFPKNRRHHRQVNQCPHQEGTQLHNQPSADANMHDGSRLTPNAI